MHLSIVTTVCDRAAIVAGAVQSLRQQTWTDWEHGVQEGGSTDGTLDMLAGLCKGRTGPESGSAGEIYNALNRGPARTTGEVVGFLHSDDCYIAPDVLAKVAQAFENPQVDFVYGNLRYGARSDSSRVIRTWRSAPFRPAPLGRSWMSADPSSAFGAAEFGWPPPRLCAEDPVRAAASKAPSPPPAYLEAAEPRLAVTRDGPTPPHP